MKTGKLLISIGIVLTSIVFIALPSCKKEETSTVNAEDTATSFSFVSNGTAVNANIGRNTLTFMSQEGHVGRRLEVVANAGTNQLIVSALCWDFQNPPLGAIKTKKYYPNPLYGTSITTPSTVVLTDMGAAVWIIDTKTYLCSGSANNSEFVEITKCDNGSKKISGSFKFTIKEMTNLNDSLIISGSFKNQPYIVVNK